MRQSRAGEGIRELLQSALLLVLFLRADSFCTVGLGLPGLQKGSGFGKSHLLRATSSVRAGWTGRRLPACGVRATSDPGEMIFGEQSDVSGGQVQVWEGEERRGACDCSMLDKLPGQHFSSLNLDACRKGHSYTVVRDIPFSMAICGGHEGRYCRSAISHFHTAEEDCAT